MKGEIVVLAEHRQGELREITFEMASLARELGAAGGHTTSALLVGHEADALAAALGGAADRLVRLEHPELGPYDAEGYLAALGPWFAERRPALVLLGHTAAGMDLAPALAARLGAPLATDCVAARWQADGLGVTRHVYGGKLVEELTLAPAATVMLTVRPGSWPTVAPSLAAVAEPAPSTRPELGARRGRRWLGYELAGLADVDIAAADVLVSVGRGVGKPENMAAVRAFAEAIGATLSCSRPVADKGWLPKSRQVGTSGKTVRPKLYLALGISGAYQHVAGMRQAGTIIAVNRDPAAPIFEVAHYGIVADMFEVLEPLQRRLGRR